MFSKGRFGEGGKGPRLEDLRKRWISRISGAEVFDSPGSETSAIGFLLRLGSNFQGSHIADLPPAPTPCEDRGPRTWQRG